MLSYEKVEDMYLIRSNIEGVKNNNCNIIKTKLLNTYDFDIVDYNQCHKNSPLVYNDGCALYDEYAFRCEDDAADYVERINAILLFIEMKK